MEEWKDIMETNNKYEVSNFGYIRNKKTNRILKPYENNGYLCINLSDGRKSIFYTVSRLVAQYYIENPENKEYVNHIDGNKLNNIYTNLEWSTQKENVAHANKTGLNPFHREPVNQYDKNDNYIKTFDSIEEAALSIDKTRHTIIRVLKGKNKTGGGYKWKYAIEKNKIDSLDDYVPIKDYPNYSVSKSGNIYSIKNKKILKPVPNKKGYCYVTLCNNNKKHNYYIHQLVAQHFIENDEPNNKIYVNHKDKNKANNVVDNLEWCTASENILHAIN